MAQETTPLLPDDHRGHDDGRPPAQVEDGPSTSSSSEKDQLPVVQLLWLCYARAMDGVAEALFALTQIACMPLWGRLAGRFRRKSLVAISLVGVALANTAFGFSTAVWQMMLIRCIAGFFSASAPTPRTEARIFSLFPLANNFGMFFGPIIGGFLSDPVSSNSPNGDKYPLLVKYPYALATSTAGAIIASAAVTTWLFVEEVSGETDATRTQSSWSLIRTRNVMSALFIYFCTLMLAIGFTAVLPAFMFSAIEDGGYEFSPSQISAFIALSGCSQAAWAFFVYPPLDRRIERARLIRYCYYGWPLFFLLGPFCNALLKRGLVTAFWMIAPTGVVLLNYISITFSAMAVLINDVATSKQALEVLNILALVGVSVARAAAPGFFGAVYAAGARLQILAGEFVWLVFIVLWIPPMLVLQFSSPVTGRARE